MFDNPTISGLTLVNPEAYVKTEKGREVGKTQRTVRSKDALVIVEGKYLAGNFRQYADYTVRLDAPADQIRLQFAQERANYLPGHEVEKLLRWYDSFTWPSWEAYKARVTVDKVINIKPILAAATSAAMLTEGEERPQTVPLKEFIRNIITRDDLFEKIDFVPTVSPHIHFKAPAYSQDDEKDLYTILAELIAYKFQPNMKGKIRIFVDNNKVYITKNCRIDWDEIKKKYDELLAENNLYVFHNEDGSIGELAHKIRVPEVLTSLGIFKPATQKEIDDLFASSKGRDTMFFNRRGISFPQDNSPEGLYMAQIASQKIGAELKVVDGGNESGEVTFEISFSHETPFTVIDQAMQTSTNVVNGSKVGIVAFFPNLANRGAFRSIDRMVFEKGSEGVRQLYSEGAESLGYLKDGRPDPTAIFNVNITKEGMDENSKFLQTLLIVHSLALNNYFLEQARKDNIPVQIQAYTAESFGVVTSAVASGALSLKDALKIIDDVLQGLIESKNDSLGEEHYAVRLVGENLGPIIKNYEFARHDTVGSSDLYDIYVKASDLDSFLSDMQANHREVSVTNRGKIRVSYLYSVAHTSGLHHARVFAERSIEANNIHFKDPQIPIISNNNTGILTTAEQVKKAVLDIFDRPMISDKTIDMTLGMHPNMIVEMGLGVRTGEWIETKKVPTPFFQFSGETDNEHAVFHAIQTLTTERSHVDAAQNTGGIDLTTSHMNLQTMHTGGKINFYLDPAMLQQLQNAPGFVPVIINVKPMTNLALFLGINPGKEEESLAKT